MQFQFSAVPNELGEEAIFSWPVNAQRSLQLISLFSINRARVKSLPEQHVFVAVFDPAAAAYAFQIELNSDYIEVVHVLPVFAQAEHLDTSTALVTGSVLMYVVDLVICVASTTTAVGGMSLNTAV